MTTDNAMRLATLDTVRGADISDLVRVLRTQRDINADRVVPARCMRYERGLLVVTDTEPIGMSETGDPIERNTDIRFRPTAGFEQDLAEMLSIPHKYVQKMRADAAEIGDAGLLDVNVNHWLLQLDKAFLVRALHSGEDDSVGIARALRSDSYGVYDNLDILLGALQGVSDAGLEYEVIECRLTEKSMHVRITAPAITAVAPLWAANYRSPFDGEGGGNLQRVVNRNADRTDRHGRRVGDLVEAGIDIKNSETGDGSAEVAPWVRLLACLNGMTMTRDAIRRPHRGSKMEPGIVRYAADTQLARRDVARKEARDAVTTFLDVDYLRGVIERVESKSDAPVRDIPKTVERVAKRFNFTDAEADTILAAFTASGQVNAGGVMNAVTAAAQTLDNADRATHLEESAMDVLDFAAAIGI